MKELITIINNENLGKILTNVSLKNYNTYKIDISAKTLYYPSNITSLKKVIKYLKSNNLKYMILGKGSNVIFNMDYYDGMIIKLDELNEIKIDGTTVKVGAGYPLVKLALETANLGLSGLEFASGIPGSVGGAVYMNAGAYKSDMSAVIKEIEVLTPKLEIKTLSNEDLNFRYRTSFLKDNRGYVCLNATLELKEGDKNEILSLIKNRSDRRIESQPLEYPSAGSVFRNPDGDFAGRLIEELNLKGYNIKGAEISTKHANFIINKGDCSGENLVDLINLVKNKVKEEYDIDLILEQEIVE